MPFKQRTMRGAIISATCFRTPDLDVSLSQLASAKMLAKEVAHSRKAKERILIAKTNLNSMEMQISSQVTSSVGLFCCRSVSVSIDLLLRERGSLPLGACASGYVCQRGESCVHAACALCD